MTTRRLVDPGVKRLWDQLEDQEYAIVIERRRLQDIWKQISAMHKANAEARAEFEKKAAFDFIPSVERMTLNVGGHIFETTAAVLCRDRYSFLAALCKTSPPINKDKKGAFFFDRDWWIFRYILQFLRTGGDLPQDHALLREMYNEGSFYRLNSLRRAIERRAAETALADGAKPPAEVPEFGTSRHHWHSTGGATSRETANPRPSRHHWHTTGESGSERAAADGRQWALPSSPYRAPLPDPYGFRGK